MSSPVLPDDPQLDVPAVIVPDRADAPISEITERFFRAVLLKVPLDRIEELHLFSPLRQGGVETGIAVIAAREVIAPPVVEASAAEAIADPELPLDASPVVEGARTETESVEMESASAESALTESALPESTETEVTDTAPTELEPTESESIDAESAVVQELTEDADDSPYADGPAAEELAEPDGVDGALEAQTAEDSTLHAEQEIAVVAVAPAPKIRHTVFTARYRLVQKGPERGKWEADVVAEAEAPLITVETVVRGVQRRAGEESDTTRFTGPQIARALRLDLGAA